ncbi:endo-1,4-beta-xylanase [Truepera radiovictrix]|nr:endo-1,4-beta-xylanase [Truepera radiovictrix]WMT56238.1 endo-1,4-beta-xylanase [Truepera radiovictrix]
MRRALVFLVLLALTFGHAQLARGHDKFLGNILGAQLEPDFATLWNQVTPENAGKWGSVEAQRGTMTWGVLDGIFAYAREHDLPVKQHTFVWGQQQPRWLGDLPPAEQRAAVEAWIWAFAERYPDVALVDVVNEPLHAPPSYKEALGGDGETGWDWVVWAFERAREALPEAKLLINEYNILCCEANRERYAEIVRLLDERGLIDGVGVQAHGLETVSPETVSASLDALGELGVPIYVSELDLETADDARQLELYRSLFPVLWEHEAVAGVTLWGYRAGAMWKPNAYLIDWFDEPRPAMTWLRSYLESQR